MDHYLFAGMTPAERRTHLEAEAFKVIEDEPYARTLEESELDERKNQVLSTLEKMDALSDEKKETLADFKAREGSHKKTLGVLKQELRSGTTQEVGTLYYIADYDARKMNLYNEDGALVHSRGLLPEERQQNMFMRRASND